LGGEKRAAYRMARRKGPFVENPERGERQSGEKFCEPARLRKDNGRGKGRPTNRPGEKEGSALKEKKKGPDGQKFRNQPIPGRFRKGEKEKHWNAATRKGKKKRAAGVSRVEGGGKKEWLEKPPQKEKISILKTQSPYLSSHKHGKRGGEKKKKKKGLSFSFLWFGEGSTEIGTSSKGIFRAISLSLPWKGKKKGEKGD